MAQLVKHLPSAQVVIRESLGSSPTSGSLLNEEPASPSPSAAALSLSQIKPKKKKKSFFKKRMFNYAAANQYFTELVILFTNVYADRWICAHVYF